MPTIPTLKKSSKKSTHHNNTDMRKLRQEAYNNSSWRKLRQTYIKNNPLCEDCLKQGKVTPAQDIHHDKSPFKNGEVNQHLLLDYNNLVALCKECHSLRHNKEQGYITPQEILRQLEELMDENKPDEYFE